MNVVHDRAEARHLPSRHHFAVFRLAAFLRIRNAPVETEELILAVQDYQSTREVLLVGTWFFATAACYLATFLQGWPVALAAPVAFAAAVVLFQIVFIAFGITVAPLLRRMVGSRSENNAGINSAFCILVLGAASAWFMREPSWVRIVASIYFLCVATNASAAVLLRLLRRQVAALETSYGGVASGA